MSTVLVWTNIALFSAAALAAFGALNKMHVKTTRPCLIAAVLLIAIGCAGQAAGQLSSQWDHIADTLVAGGILAFMLASQRVHTWVLERFANPIASVICGVVGLIFLFWLLTGGAA